MRLKSPTLVLGVPAVRRGDAVGRVIGIARSRAIRTGLVVGVAVAALLGLAAPAWPTDISIYGTTVCTTGDQTVGWTIVNAAPAIPMTISYVVASIGSQQYTTTGWTPVVAGDASTGAITVVPAGVSGLLVLN